jgi:hypothetical protein
MIGELESFERGIAETLRAVVCTALATEQSLNNSMPNTPKNPLSNPT